MAFSPMEFWRGTGCSLGQINHKSSNHEHGEIKLVSVVRYAFEYELAFYVGRVGIEQNHQPGAVGVAFELLAGSGKGNVANHVQTSS